MKITRAVVTAAGRNQRALPLQTLIDRDGRQKSVLGIILGEAIYAGIQDICIVVSPGDEAAYRTAAGEEDGRLQFVTQQEPRGYGHAIWSAKDFVGDEPFLHMVGDHVYMGASTGSCARQVLEIAETESCAVSGVKATRENLLPYYGALGGSRVKGLRDLYAVERVREKPTPTEAEQTLLVPGLRTGHYLCLFGIHALTPAVMGILSERVAQSTSQTVGLTPALDALAGREKYLALETRGQRYPVDVAYGLFTAQLALALSGKDRAEVLSTVCEMLAQRDLDGAGV